MSETTENKREDLELLEKVEVGKFINEENGAECFPYFIKETSTTGKTLKLQKVPYSPDPRKDLSIPHQNWIYNPPYGDTTTVRFDKEHLCWRKAKSSSAFYLSDEPVHRRNWEM